MKYAAVSAVVCVTAVSCLEKYPGSAIPVEESMQTFADAEQHLIGIYSSLKSSNLYSGSLTLLPDIQADLAMAVLTNNNPHPDIWEWNIRPTNEEIEGVYGGLYSVIGNCNFYLDKIGEVMAAETDDDNLELLDTYTGEVYAIRALCYSELIKCFCEAYPASDADGNNPDDEAAKNMLLAKSQIDTKLKALTEQAETVANQEKLFIEEISRYTRALVELGTSSATTGNELLLSVTRLPKVRGPDQKEAAKLAQSMYALRMVLVKRYAESVGSGCDVQ